MNTFRNKIAIFVCSSAILLSATCTSLEAQRLEGYALIQARSLRQLPEEIQILSDAFLSRLIGEIRKVSSSFILTEDELITAFPTLKEASDIGAYTEAVHAKGLNALVTIYIRFHHEGQEHLIDGFDLTLWDTLLPGKGRLVLAMPYKFDIPQKIDAAAVSIADTFFKSSSAPAVSK